MNNKPQHDSRELSAQELSEVSGGTFAPDKTDKPIPVEPDGGIGTGGSPLNVNVDEYVNQKLKDLTQIKHNLPQLDSKAES